MIQHYTEIRGDAIEFKGKVRPRNYFCLHFSFVLEIYALVGRNNGDKKECGNPIYHSYFYLEIWSDRITYLLESKISF